MQDLAAAVETKFPDVTRSVRGRLQHLAKGLKHKGADRKGIAQYAD